MAEPVKVSRGSLGVAASLVIVFAGLKLAAPVVIPVLLALTVTVALQPFARWLRALKAPNVLVVTASVILLLALLAAIFALLLYAGNELTQAAPRLQKSAAGLRGEAIEWLISRDLTPLAKSLQGVDYPERALATVVGTVKSIAGLISLLLAVLILAIFMLLEATTAALKLELLARGTGRSEEDWRRALRDVQRYLVVKTTMSALTGVLVGVWTFAFGIDGALLWGVLAFVLNFIPVIGSIVASVPAVLLALVDAGLPIATIVGAGYLAINLSVSNLLEPRVMGRTLGLAPIVVLFSVLLWGFILGPVGALLSVPLTMAAKIALERSRRYSWIAEMMEPGHRAARSPS